MPAKKWRTVSCVDDSFRSHPSQPKAYEYIGDQPAGARFRVWVDDGFGWQAYATAVSRGDGTTDEE